VCLDDAKQKIPRIHCDELVCKSNVQLDIVSHLPMRRKGNASGRFLKYSTRILAFLTRRITVIELTGNELRVRVKKKKHNQNIIK